MRFRPLPSPSSADPASPPLPASLAGAAAAVLAGSAATLVASLVLRVVLARALDPAQLGALLFAFAVVSFAGGTASLGLRSATARRIAALRTAGEDGAAARAARTALVLAAAAGGGVTLLALLPAALEALGALGSLQAMAARLQPVLLLAVSPVALGLAVGAAAWGISQGYDDTRGRVLVRDTGGGILRLAGVGGAVLADGGLVSIALGWAVGSLLAEAALVVYARASGWLQGTSSDGAASRWDRDLVASLPPFAGWTVLNQARNWLDMVLLGLLAPLPVVGLYGLAQAVSRVLRMVATVADHRFLPAATAAVARRDEEALARVHRRSRDLALAFLWAPLAPCLLVPEPLVRLAFGPEYAGAAEPLRILAAGILVPALVGYGEEVLVARDRTATVFRLGLASTVLSALLLVALVPVLGALGAALAATLGAVLRAAVAFGLLGGRLRRATVERPAGLLLAAVPVLLAALVGEWGDLSGLLRLVLVTAAATPPALLALGTGLRGETRP